jgi:hypothetical protein
MHSRLRSWPLQPRQQQRSGSDPEETCNETLIDHELSNVEGAKRIVTASASNFVGCADRLASLMREKGEETHDTRRDEVSFGGVRVMMARTWLFGRVRRRL